MAKKKPMRGPSQPPSDVLSPGQLPWPRHCNYISLRVKSAQDDDCKPLHTMNIHKLVILLGDQGLSRSSVATRLAVRQGVPQPFQNT